MAQPSLFADISFLARDPVYETTRVYDLDYKSKQVPSNNLKTVVEPNVPIFDLREAEKSITFQNSGIAILDLETAMEYEDFAHEDRIMECYFQEVGQILLDYLGAASIQIFDYSVSKRTLCGLHGQPASDFIASYGRGALNMIHQRHHREGRGQQQLHILVGVELLVSSQRRDCVLTSGQDTSSDSLTNFIKDLHGSEADRLLQGRYMCLK